MLIDTFTTASLTDIKTLLLEQTTVFDVALAYVLVYVIYKSLGRYIYFKPQEHSSKINRTFLILSLIVVLIGSSANLVEALPFQPENRWVFLLSSVVLIFAVFAITFDRLVWKYNESGYKSARYDKYLPIEKDYYKTNIPKETASSSGLMSHWEEEGVRSTRENLHSDTAINFLSLVVFNATTLTWGVSNMNEFGWPSMVMSGILIFVISILFVNQGIVSWIPFFERKTYSD